MVLHLDKFEQSVRDGRFSDAEIQCKGFLISRDENGCDDMTMMSVLYCLAQALEDQGKIGEAFNTRLKVRKMLTARHSGEFELIESDAYLY